MIYSSFESINRRYGYIHESMEEIKKSMLEYLHDAVEEVGVIIVQYNSKMAHLAIRIEDKGKTKQYPILIDKNLGETWCSELSFETCYDICRQVREMHLFKEWGDPEDEEPQPAEEAPAAE